MTLMFLKELYGLIVNQLMCANELIHYSRQLPTEDLINDNVVNNDGVQEGRTQMQTYNNQKVYSKDKGRTKGTAKPNIKNTKG